jgi:hypothetical protein
MGILDHSGPVENVEVFPIFLKEASLKYQITDNFRILVRCQKFYVDPENDN